MKPSCSWLKLPRLFITGTDTGVGKTCVTAALATSLLREGRKVAALKPLETGARGADRDARILAQALGWPARSSRELGYRRFSRPVSPELAARLEGTTLSLARVNAWIRDWEKRGYGHLLVEGVGGLLTPLTPKQTVADWAAALGWPLVVVARSGLGTINHTLLTLEAAERRDLKVAAVIFNPGYDRENARAILRHGKVPVAGCLEKFDRRTSPDRWKLRWIP